MDGLKLLRKLSKFKYNEIGYTITEKDFYPPEDTRILQSGIEDIIKGDNFQDYVKYYFDNYENDLFDV